MRVEQGNSVRQFSAVNALRTSSTVSHPENKSQDNIINNTSSGTKSAPKSLLDKVDVADVRKYAEFAGEYNITDEDIKYGLMYGRSVIAEYLC